MTEKISRKKLTDTGATVCVLTFIALILSLAGVFTDFIGVIIYNNFFENTVSEIFVTDAYSYISLLEKPVILSMLAMIVFVLAVKGRRKKRNGGEFAGICISMPLVLGVRPVLEIMEIIKTGEFSQAFNFGSDGDRFRAMLNLSIYVLPLISCLFILISGLICASRLIDEDYQVRTPVVKRVAVMKESDNPAQPNPMQGFEFNNAEFMRPESAPENGGAEPVMAQMMTSENAEKAEQTEEIQQEIFQTDTEQTNDFQKDFPDELPEQICEQNNENQNNQDDN